MRINLIILLVIISTFTCLKSLTIIFPSTECRDISVDVLRIMKNQLHVDDMVDTIIGVNLQLKKLDEIEAWADKQDACSRNAYKDWTRYFRKELNKKGLPPVVIPVPTPQEVGP